MHEDDEEADMRTQEELMMQHRYMMVSPLVFHNCATLHLPCCLHYAATGMSWSLLVHCVALHLCVMIL